MNKVGITFDIDWAPDGVVEYVLSLLEEYQVRATFFATHDSALLKSLDSARYEISIHPNFSDSNNHDKTIAELKAVYHEALGVRSHGLFQSSHLLQLFINNGLRYDVNTFIPLREGLYPFMRLNKLVCIPYYWEDDAHFSSQTKFELSELELRKKGLKIYNFHPMHVFMNTDSQEHYSRYKPFYHQPDILRKHRNSGKGIGTLFKKLIQYLSENILPTYTRLWYSTGSHFNDIIHSPMC